MAAPANPLNLPATVERFFEVSLYLLVFTGFATLAGTGQLDLPFTLLVSGAVLYRGWLLWRRKQARIPDSWATWLTVAYIGFYIADLLLLTNFIVATVHLVLFGMVVKLFSVQRFRDHMYLAVLAFLMVLAAAILTVDALFFGAFTIFVLLAITTFVSLEMKRSLAATAAVAGVHESVHRPERRLPKSLAWTAAALMLAITVGSVVIFFLMPRMSAGYMSAFAPRNEIVTGFSDTVQLGQIGRIQQSNAVVMHVQVRQGSVPADLKWRGVALSHFDGKSWSAERDAIRRVQTGGDNIWLAGLRINGQQVFPAPSPASGRLQYRILLEPIGSPVFFLADSPVLLRGNYRDITVDAAGAVSASDRMVGAYDAVSDLRRATPELRRDESYEFPPHITHRNLQLPPGMDVRIKELAQRVTQPGRTNYERAMMLEHHLRTEYGYTLQLLNGTVDDPLAHFLFERRQGHCEYFASAMAVMLRSIGIPSRIVNGFRNGEVNEITGSYVVRARNAHAWVEAYFPNHGWLAFDPTPADPSANADSLSRVSMYMDAMREFWREWVVNYDFVHQASLSQRLTRQSRDAVASLRMWWKTKYRAMVQALKNSERGVRESLPLYVAGAAAGLMLFLLLLVTPRLLRRWRARRLSRNPVQAPDRAATLWYEKTTTLLGRKGWPRAPGLTAPEYALSVHDAKLQQPLHEFVRCYEQARFGKSGDAAERLPGLYSELRDASKH